MRPPLLLLRRLLTLYLVVVLELIAAGPLHGSDSDSGVQRMPDKFVAVKNVSKRHVRPEGSDCCEPGYFKDAAFATSSNTMCKECVEGEEYTDHYNCLPKCLRCSFCDAQHGFEVDKPCIRSRNVTCRCRQGFFCDSSELCAHCDPCTKCEYGIIVEECTRTKDTICKPNLLWLIGIFIPLGILIPLAIFMIWKYWYKKYRMPQTPIKDEHKTTEQKPLIYSDIDLTPHLSDIAEEMTLEQVLRFVRKQGLTNPTIERIEHDNMHDASEKKIKLLDEWFQENGIKDAYRTLISSLKDLKLCTLAERIEQKMPPCIQSNAKTPVKQNIASVEENSPL